MKALLMVWCHWRGREQWEQQQQQQKHGAGGRVTGKESRPACKCVTRVPSLPWSPSPIHHHRLPLDWVNQLLCCLSHGIPEKVSPAGIPWHLCPPPPAWTSIPTCAALLVIQLSGGWHFTLCAARRLWKGNTKLACCFSILKILSGKYRMDMLRRGLVPFDCFILFFRQNNAVLVWALGCLEKKGKCLLLLAKHQPGNQPNHRS